MKMFLGGVLILCASQSFAAEYLVKYNNTKALQSIQQMASLKSTGMAVVDQHEPGSYVVVDVSESEEVATMGTLMSDPDIAWVVPNFKIHAFEAPVAPTLKPQWALEKVQATQAWVRATNRGSKNVLVAVIDTGVDYNHKNLIRNMVPGFDFRDNDADPMDEVGRNTGHGTHCAGVIGADGSVDGGIVGISPDVSVMPIRFLGKDGSGDLNGGIKAIDYAIEKGVQVISASWGANVPAAQATALIEAVKRADEKGIVFVAAAANSGRNNDYASFYPTNANTPNMIAVAASGSTDTKPSWSNYGRAMVHVAAPGEGIMSTIPGDKYSNMSGTSMATPLVAGLVALVKAQDPTLTGAQIRALLQTTGAKAKIETACNCRIDALGAIDLLMSKKMWLVPAATTMAEGQTTMVSVMNGKAPFVFTSSNPEIMTVDETGLVTPVIGGMATISVTDAAGQTVSSLEYHSLKKGGSAPGEPGQCSLRSPKLCNALCKLFPNMRHCKKP
jgi:thermitase